MATALVVLHNEARRAQAINYCKNAPLETRVEFKQPRRSIKQNRRMWAMLHAVSEQLPWHGLHLSAEDWKIIFLDALKRELRIVPNIEGNGFVNLGRSSSDLSVDEMNELMSLIEAFAANKNINIGWDY